ncbi:hypothetical protein V9K67_17920 [Paraflavisolibacter sp. H34]|uniref:LA_2272 family surface repeat-containing protein n=1 Tax=Huijunlia imazamoxiresistens TaxID=3127457 RepID=UPI00301AEAEF
MKGFFTVILSLVLASSYGQEKQHYFPVFTFHKKNANIHGVSLGFWNFSSKPRNTTTNGLRLSLIGEGIVVPFVAQDPLADNDSLLQEVRANPVSERVNGISFSTLGNAGAYAINGMALGYVGHFHQQVNGISVAALNFSQLHNGVQAAVFMNECAQMKGVQVGFWNISKKTRGVQIGLWNVNEKRKLPLLNWNFRN